MSPYQELYGGPESSDEDLPVMSGNPMLTANQSARNAPSTLTKPASANVKPALSNGTIGNGKPANKRAHADNPQEDNSSNTKFAKGDTNP